ncbi:hypothetical protein [Nitrosomonas sp. Nm58]|uniref:hypothetical protein n=1 Tax=Nitrosomonas sp. Nm58 TaxID=200126 RepID=UPI000898D80A|nr:hypothetical protein [Nitrosomonas sp. Nm58]SDY77830.1 hypothetical protein SAMN05421754_102146 [Nitrosomonas sp. Nm58]
MDNKKFKEKISAVLNRSSAAEKRDFKRPVSWLMGRELLAGLKYITAYIFMGDKQDPRDWMYAKTITPPRCNNGDQESYWFDYIADTGDGMRAVYNIAYLCMSDVWIKNINTPGQDQVSLIPDNGFEQRLPRGEFLFVGGDTAYHIADIASLRERFQIPFNWAYQDISISRVVDQRPIYGIPANHDYYDALDGFNRQFCHPITDDTTDPSCKLDDLKDPQLGLYGFKRTQTASYVALHLPFGWQLWGLDSQEGKMDKRQQAFFVSGFYPKLVKDGTLFDENKKDEVLQTLKDSAPNKLIIATPEPSTVFGKPATKDDQITKTFERLGLEPSFLNGGKLNPDKCRLDISGNIHHYERYWGTTPNNSMSSNYASVVAGGGGAFLHPSHTDVAEIEKQSLYPNRKDSHIEITQKILNPWNIFHGGYIWLAGAIISLITYFAVTIPQSTWSLFELIPDNLRPTIENQDLLARIRLALDTSTSAQNTEPFLGWYLFDLIYILLLVGFLAYWWMRTPDVFKLYKYSDAKEGWSRSILKFIAPIVFAFIFLIALIYWHIELYPLPFLAGLLIDLYFIAAVLIFSLSRRYSDILIDRSKLHRETLKDLMPLWVLGIIGTVYAGFGFLHYGVYKSSIMSFDLLVAVIWSLATIGLVALAFFGGGKLSSNTAEKAKFAAIGLWHSILQVVVPVCLALYASWTNLLVISLITVAVTLVAGYVFTRERLVKDLSKEDQSKIGNWLFAAWGIVGVVVLLAAAWGGPVAVDSWRLLAVFVLGGLFSCIWFGWYLAVSLAFNGHNNEAGGGARSENYRHMIRFKLTEDTLTGYVIGIDTPVENLSTKPPKFRLVDVFTLQAKK